ncbi:MAG TPA: DUF5132 domain-containing protein [Methylomirabilota bacterium]|jgi:hypothetical protein|nr:DUF5132 domain-containing protein [Methylomirabilota bacterium]
MALLEDLFSDWGWGTTGMVGLGAVLLAPTVLPAVGAVLRPVAKGLVRGTLALTEGARELFAEAREQLSDIYAEAKHEYAQGRGPFSSAPSATSTTVGAESLIVTPSGEPAARE